MLKSPGTLIARLIPLLFVSLSLTAAPQTDQSAKPPTQPEVEAPAATLVELNQQLERLIQDNDIPGAQLALYDANGVYWSKEYGSRDIAAKQPMTAATLLRAGSTTKTFIALAIMQMVKQGKLSLDDKLVDIAPEIQLQNLWREQFPVRIVHLLQHTAGLDDMHFRNFYNIDEPEISLLDAINRDSGALKVRWQPGTRQAYSNPGFAILGYLLEKASGENYESYIEQNILKPLAMDASNMHFDSTVAEHLSHGYADGEAVVRRDIYLRPAGALYSNAQELAQLGRFLLSRGQSGRLWGIDAEVISQMEQPASTLAAKAGLDYGYGSGIYHATRGGQDWLGHNGGIDGFLTSYGYSPQSGHGYALMINSSTASLRPILDTITRFLAKDVKTILPQAVEGIDPALNGYYRIANDRNQIMAGISYPLGIARLQVDGTELHIYPIMGEDKTLLHMGGQKFREAKQDFATALFLGEIGQGKALEVEGQFLLQTSALAFWGPIVFLGLNLLLILFTVIYLPVWLVNWGRGKIESGPRLKLRAFPAFAVFSLALCIFCLTQLSLLESGQLNWKTLGIFVTTLLFAVFGVMSLWQVRQSWQFEPGRFARYFSLASSLAIVSMSLYFWHFDYLGLSLWRW